MVYAVIWMLFGSFQSHKRDQKMLSCYGEEVIDHVDSGPEKNVHLEKLLAYFLAK